MTRAIPFFLFVFTSYDGEKCENAKENEDILQDFTFFWRYNVCRRSENT